MLATSSSCNSKLFDKSSIAIEGGEVDNGATTTALSLLLLLLIDMLLVLLLLLLLFDVDVAVVALRRLIRRPIPSNIRRLLVEAFDDTDTESDDLCRNGLPPAINTGVSIIRS